MGRNGYFLTDVEKEFVRKAKAKIGVSLESFAHLAVMEKAEVILDETRPGTPGTPEDTDGDNLTLTNL